MGSKILPLILQLLRAEQHLNLSERLQTMAIKLKVCDPSEWIIIIAHHEQRLETRLDVLSCLQAPKEGGKAAVKNHYLLKKAIQSL